MTAELDLSTVAARLKYAREFTGRSQGSVETAMMDRGIWKNRGSLSRLESGDRGGSTISLEILGALADVLGVRFDWLARGRGPMREGPENDTPFDAAARFAREAGCREDAIAGAERRHADHAAKMTVFDWVNAIQAEALALTAAGVARPEVVSEHRARVRRKKRELLRSDEKEVPHVEERDPRRGKRVAG